MIHAIFLLARLVLRHHVNKYSPAKTGEYPRISPKLHCPIFKFYVHYDNANITWNEKYLFVHRVVPENTDKNTSHAENSELLVSILSRAAKYLKDEKHNSPYSTRKCARIFVFEHYLLLEAHFLSFSSIYFVLWILNVVDRERWYRWKISVNIKNWKKRLISLFSI